MICCPCWFTSPTALAGHLPDWLTIIYLNVAVVQGEAVVVTQLGLSPLSLGRDTAVPVGLIIIATRSYLARGPFFEGIILCPGNLSRRRYAGLGEQVAQRRGADDSKRMMIYIYSKYPSSWPCPYHGFKRAVTLWYRFRPQLQSVSAAFVDFNRFLPTAGKFPQTHQITRCLLSLSQMPDANSCTTCYLSLCCHSTLVGCPCDIVIAQKSSLSVCQLP